MRIGEKAYGQFNTQMRHQACFQVKNTLLIRNFTGVLEILCIFIAKYVLISPCYIKKLY